MSISAVILSFNAKEDLKRCVSSLIEIEGLRAGRDQILVIDSDIEFRMPVLGDLIQSLADDPSIGIITPKLIFPDGRRQLSTDQFPTVPRKLERLFRLRTLEQRMAEGWRESRPVDYAISAFWLMRRDLIDRVGPLDEQIFYAPEDVDFCLRVWLSGKRVIYRSDLEVVHDAKERSRSLRSLLFTWRHVQGLAYFFKKHGYAFSTKALHRRISGPGLDTATPIIAPELERRAGG